ncbi:MAG TPA: chorismate mutase [Lachnospiraceae bacterium]|nr:chorismate mutase [Lachnospiraceae bacterium]
MQCNSLEEVRENIDQIDRQIIHLLAQRGGFVNQASRFKKDTNEVKAPNRVEAIIEKVKGLAIEEGIDAGLVESVYRTMISEFIGLEMKEFQSER